MEVIWQFYVTFTLGKSFQSLVTTLLELFYQGENSKPTILELQQALHFNF